jgi:RNA polymerase sigma-70 factor (ECF subfamily)
MLVERARLGNMDAFAGVYRRYRDRVSTYVAARIGPWEEVEAVTQEVLVRALTGLPRFEPKGPSSFESWLFVIAHNAVETHRGERSRVRPEDPELISLRTDCADFAQEDTVLGPFARSEFERLIRPLPQRQREVLVLRVLLDFHDAQIALALDINEPAVRQAARQGLRTLRARQTAAAEQALVLDPRPGYTRPTSRFVASATACERTHKKTSRSSRLAG